MIAAGLMMLCLLIVQVFNNRIVGDAAGALAVNRFSKYVYWIPQTLNPALFLMACVWIRRGGQERKRGDERVLLIPAALRMAHEVDTLLQPGGRLYEQREVVVNALNRIDGVSAVRPEGAFYIFPKIDTEKFNITNDTQFVLDFLHEQHVLMIAGSGFNWPEPNHFRVVYLPDVDTLTSSMNKLETFQKTYRQK